MHPQTSHNGESLTPDQINELLTSIDSVSGPASPPDSNYTYASVTSSAAPHVVLSPSWTLPRRADHNALASLQHYQANNPLPDMDTLNMSSGVHSPMLSAAEVSGMLSQSPPGSSFHPFMSSELSMPFSAPPESYEFDQTFMGQQHDFLNPHRQPSWPVSPPQSTPSPLPQVARAGTLPPEPLSAAGPSMFTRRRSISMSGMDLEAATMAVNNTTASSTGPVRPKPNRHRSASNLAHTRPPPASRPQQDSLYSLPRSPSAKERRAVASKRRATLQSVVR